MILGDIYLNSIGVYLPRYVSASSAVEAGLYDDELRLESGIEGTHVSEDIGALDMAVLAARAAVDRGSVPVESIDYVAYAANYYVGPVGWTAPGYVMRELGIKDASSVQVNQECNGMMAALEVAVGQFTGAAGRHTALLTTGSNYASPLVDRWRGAGPQAVFADGAGAMILSGREGFAELLSLNSATLPSAEGWLRGSGTLLPPGREVNWLFDPVQRAIDYAGSSGASVQDWMDDAGAQCEDLCRRSLAEAKTETSDLAMVIGFHLARFAIEESLVGRLGLPVERTNWEYGRRIGHIGPCDHLVSLDLALRGGDLHAGDKVLLVSWGGGWNTSTAVIKILDVPDWDQDVR